MTAENTGALEQNEEPVLNRKVWISPGLTMNSSVPVRICLHRYPGTLCSVVISLSRREKAIRPSGAAHLVSASGFALACCFVAVRPALRKESSALWPKQLCLLRAPRSKPRRLGYVSKASRLTASAVTPRSSIRP